jgi:hypothetical protein
MNLAAVNDRERDECLAARRAARLEGVDPLADVGVASSGSRGIKPRSYRQWDAREQRFRVFDYDAIGERWVERDARPRWMQDLDAVRARLAAKGKIPRSVRW